MSASRVENASEIVDVGEQVWIKVIGREVTTHTHTNKHWAVSLKWVSRLTVPLFPVSQIRGDKVKLSFSMKAVNQGTGRDLDPNNVNAEYVLAFVFCVYVCVSLHGCMERCVLLLSVCDCRQDARRRKQFRDHTGNRITLEAVLNTTCSKCGCKGTIAKGMKRVMS